MLDVPDVAVRLLTLGVDTATALEVELPDRRYVAPGVGGAEAWDTEQFTVGLMSIDPISAATSATGAGGSSGGWFGPPSATFRLEVVRSTPTMDEHGEYFDDGVYHQSGMQAMGDAALLSAVRGLVPSLFDDDGRTVRLGQVIPSGPEGGFCGMTLLVAVDLL